MAGYRRNRQSYACALIAIFLLTGTGISGCTSIHYFGQAVRGHTQIMLASKPVASLVQDEDIPPEVRRKLVLSQKIRKFATAELGLPDNGSYLRYARIDRPYVMWNVFASAELSFDAHSWCYPVVGCLSYRGYYDHNDALELANKLQAQGADVYVAPVAAYSTLGWFADPLISPMMRWPDEELARVIFHELAHQQRYIRDDTELNEAYATALAEIALLAWGHGRAEFVGEETLELKLTRDASFINLLLDTRKALEEIFKSSLGEAEKRQGKALVFEKLTRDYRQWRERWHGYTGFDKWMQGDMNNAKLSSIATYHGLVPLLMKRTATANSHRDRIVRLTALIDGLSRLSYAQRRACLESVVACEIR